jgi:hypothetical protein
MGLVFRANHLMTDIAKALEEPMIADVAAYDAGQPKRNANPATLGDLPPLSCALSSSATPIAIFRAVPPAIARDPADPSKLRSSRSKVVSTGATVTDVRLGRAPQ